MCVCVCVWLFRAWQFLATYFAAASVVGLVVVEVRLSLTMATSARKSAAASAVAMTVFVVLVAALAVLPHGALGERRCRNPACTEAISIVRAFRDFYAPDGSFSFRRLATFSVLSKDGNMWEGNVRLHRHSHHQHPFSAQIRARPEIITFAKTVARVA